MRVFSSRPDGFGLSTTGIVLAGVAATVAVGALVLAGPAGWHLALACTPCGVATGLALRARGLNVRRSEAELRATALTRSLRLDPLTGLATRDGLIEQLRHLLQTRGGGVMLGVLYCDLDGLKRVNDSLGHGVGDEILRGAADRLRSLKSSGDLLARIGGDEFVLVTRDLPAVRDLQQLADRVTEALRQPHLLVGERSQVVSGSVGIAYRIDERSGTETVGAEELLRDADVAMYRAKDLGPGSAVLFDQALRDRAIARFELEQELRSGLDAGQVTVHYQPVISRSSGEVRHCEALIRWQHPVLGMVHPAEFLPVAAESWLIVELGQLVLDDACRAAARWSAAAGHPIAVSVNIGERQLLDLRLVDQVRQALDGAGLPAAQLELELAEELVIDRVEEAAAVLGELDRLGVHLAIDDFGTSQASVGLLRSMPLISTVKLDRLFVEHVATDEVDRKVVSAVVAVADSVGLTVIGEGVETQSQAEALARLGIDLQQGFYYCRPGPAEAMMAELGVVSEAMPPGRHPSETGAEQTRAESDGARREGSARPHQDAR